MEQQYNINSTFTKLSLIGNIPIEFSINNARPIKFTLPTIKDVNNNLDFNVFSSIISLTPEKIKNEGINLNFLSKSKGDIIQGLIYSSQYRDTIIKYFLKYINNSALKDDGIYLNDVKILSYELEYIANIILISIGVKEFDESLIKQKSEEELDPLMAEILRKQKESEERLKEIKAKKAKNSNAKYGIEEISLAVCYEFGLKMDDIMEMNYFTLIWYFKFVSKVDGHKLKQLILSSGFSKQKSYSYWLNE